MADKRNRYEENVPGKWYVDRNCVICGACSEYAPAVFRTSSDHDHNYVFHQPATADELAAAEEMRQGCPVDAIGNDG